MSARRGTPVWGVYTHTQPSRAHQGTGSAHTGTPAWGVHTQTATQGSPGHRVCAHRHTCVGCTHTATQGSPGRRVCAHRYTCVGCAHTQPRRAHQGEGSEHTGTHAWGVHGHTASWGSPGHSGSSVLALWVERPFWPRTRAELGADLGVDGSMSCLPA